MENGGFGERRDDGSKISTQLIDEPIVSTQVPKRKSRLAHIKARKAQQPTLDDIPSYHRTSSTILLHGDASREIARLPAGSINTCLTSPPYWQARDYGAVGQIGQEKSLETYISRIVETFSAVRHALTEDGTAWLNLGDTYLSGVGTVKGRPPLKGWRRNKQLSLVPWRVAIALQEDGWWVRNSAVWHKPNAMPESVDDRLSNTWEPIFLLTKSERYWFNLDPIREPHRTDDSVERKRAERGNASGKAKGQPALRKHLSSPRHRATIDGLKEVRLRPYAPESIELAAYLRKALENKRMTIQQVADILQEPFERTRHYFRTDVIGSRLPPEETWPRLKDVLELDNTYDESMRVVITDNAFRNHPAGRNPGDVMSVMTARARNGHFAVMPEGLVERCLRATLPPNGTTGRVALRLGGKFVGVDLNEDYLKDFCDRSRV
jgi:DNA modification methylase